MNVNVAEPAVKTVVITPPRMSTVEFVIKGTAPLMVAKFSSKAKNKMKAVHEAGSTSKSKRVREARDFDVDVNQARHIATEGWDGVHASAFRNAMIDACRTIGYKMTHAKLAVFCVADGYDAEDGTPLVKILSEKPFETSIMHVRNATGVPDLRARPMWREWGMVVTIKHDLDMLSVEDVVNLLSRVGAQVGIGEGRPNGRSGNGMGFGMFDIIEAKVVS